MEEQIFQSPDNGISNQNPQRSPKKPSWILGKKILIGLVSGLGLILIFVMLYKTNSVAFLTHLRYQNYSGHKTAPINNGVAALSLEFLLAVSCRICHNGIFTLLSKPGLIISNSRKYFS